MRKKKSIHSRRLLLGGVLLLAFCHLLPAQPARDFPFYNDTTYRLYLAEDWDRLLPLGREAIRQGYDYYYLRMRLGLAYQAKQRPFRAARQFYRALRFSRRDSLATAFLTYNLRAGGRFDEARLFVPAPRRPWVGLGAEAGYQFSDGRTPVDDRYFASLFLRHRLGRRLFLTHQYQTLTQRFVDHERILLPPMGNGPPREVLRTTESEVNQQSYFLGGTYQLEKGWRLESGFHYLSYQDTSGRGYEQLYALNLRKDLSFMRVQAGAGLSRFHRGTQRQISAGLTFFPLGNPNLYLGNMTTLNWEATGEQDSWLSQHFGVRLFAGNWLETFYETGRIDYFFAHNGAFAYNIDDDLRERWGLSWQCWLQGRHLLYASFINEKKEWVVDNTTYHHRTLLIGLSLNFD